MQVLQCKYHCKLQKNALTHKYQTEKKDKNYQFQDFDYVYYTGDMIDHGVWETTQEGNTKSIKETLKLINDTFGSTPVFSSIGNHESQPLNQ